MRIFVIGGSGFLGGFLVPRLIATGHQVSVLTRSVQKQHALKEQGADSIIGDILQPDSFRPFVRSPELIVFIAMPPVKPGRTSKRQFRKLRDITTGFFQHAIDLARHFDCPILLTAGSNYHSSEDKIFTEQDPIQRFGMAKIGEYTDPLIAPLLNSNSPSGILMMPGQIYGPGGLFQTMYRWIKSGKYRIIGRGDNYMPRIYVEDLAEAYVQAIERMPLGERFLIADDTPCTVNDFAQFIARELDLPPVRHVARGFVRLAAGKLPYETITMNSKVSNQKAKRTLGWKPQYGFREGIRKTNRILEKKA